jgi:periplasmic protein TonB
MEYLPNPRTLSRIEVAVLLAISVVGHTALAVKLTRRTEVEPRVVPEALAIEVEPPPVAEPPKLPPPPAVRPAAAPRKVAVHAHFAPPPPVEQPPVTDTPSGAPPAPTPPPAPAASGPPGPPAPVAPAIAKPAAVVAAHEGANYLKNPRPPYPDVAMRRDWEGEVLLRVRVSQSGRVEAISVERSSGHDVLDDAAVEAVRNWSFIPSRQGGIPISGWVSVPITFRLQQGE